MRILIPVVGFGPQGGYRVLSRLADAWLALGHEVHFLVPETSGPAYFPTSAAIMYCGRNGVIPAVDPLDIAPPKWRGLHNIRCLRSGLQTIGRKFDLIIANHNLTAWPVYVTDCGGARKIYYVQAYEPAYYHLWRDPVKWLLAMLSYRLPLEQVVNASVYPQWAVGSAVGCVFPGIDLSTFCPSGRQRRFHDHCELVLGTIGRHEPHKGTRYVLQAFELLHQTHPNARLRVAFGNLPAGWHHPAAEVVEISNDSELAAFYRSLDILVVGCYGQQGAPHYPVIEGMACGTPVVHTGYYPGNSDNSWPAAPRSPAALVGAVNELLSDPEREAKIQCAEALVRDTLAWPAVARAFLDMVEDSTWPRH